MSSKNFALTVGGGVSDVDPETGQPTQGPALSVARPVKNRAREKQDEMRRPQAAHVFRMLKRRHAEGASWRELWELGEGNDEWAVGPIIVWLRKQNVHIDARYDAVLGETRFYLILVEAPSP